MRSYSIMFLCIYKKGKKISGSLRAVTDKFYEYNNSQEMVNIVKSIISKELNGL